MIKKTCKLNLNHKIHNEEVLGKEQGGELGGKNHNKTFIHSINIFTIHFYNQTIVSRVSYFSGTVQQHIPNVQQHMLDVQQHIPAVQQHIWST